MSDLKHVGRLTTNNRKCIVAYRVIPNDPDHCLVVHTESLDADQHDSLINMVQSNAGQTAYELAEAMARTTLVDGRNMLDAFHRQGKLTRVPTDIVEMVPNNQSSVNLRELNELIAQQRGVTVNELAVQGDTAPEPMQTPSSESDTARAYTNTAEHADTSSVETVPAQPSASELLTDEALASKYRSDADKLSKEAAELRRMAEELVPTKKRSTATKKTATKKTETSVKE
jgi:hypothetical protein